MVTKHTLVWVDGLVAKNNSRGSLSIEEENKGVDTVGKRRENTLFTLVFYKYAAAIDNIDKISFTKMFKTKSDFKLK